MDIKVIKRPHTMIKKLIAAMALLPFGVGAQTVPAIDKTAAMALFEISPAVELSAMERDALRITKEWKSNPHKPIRATDGGVKYVYGVTLPALVCNLLQVCAIRFQPGEIVNGIDVGDERFVLGDLKVMGSQPNLITYLTVKPKESGITTNLIVATDRRSYTIKLVSAKHEGNWMPYIEFVYPEDAQKSIDAYRAAFKKERNFSTLSTGENAAALDFRFGLGGDSPSWKPQRVYTDGVKTYIQFPDAKFPGELPALVELGKDGGLFSDESTQLVNYRLIGDRFVVDKVIDHAALISGIGKNQVRVTIDYMGGKP